MFACPLPVACTAEPEKNEEGEEDDDDEEEGDDEAFNWVFVALMSDGTLRQYTNEMMDEELCAELHCIAHLSTTFPSSHARASRMLMLLASHCVNRSDSR